MAPATIDLLPSTISSLVLSNNTSLAVAPSNATTTVTAATPDPAVLRAQLGTIPRETWLRLGCECHNASFASEIASVLATKPAASSVSMYSNAAAAAKAAALLFDNGMPRIVRTIQQHRSRSTGVSFVDHTQDQRNGHDSEEPLLWTLYNLYRQHCHDQFGMDVKGVKRAAAGRSIRQRKSKHVSLLPPGAMPWQFRFLKSGCPEIMVLVFVDVFLEFGPKYGFDRDVPCELMEAIDFEWRSNSVAARRAVLALIQTLIACQRYAKNQSSNNNSTNPDLSKTDPLLKPETTAPDEQSNKENDLNTAAHQFALTLGDACLALKNFFDSNQGRSLPKLQALYQQEVAADVKLQSRSAGGGGDRGIKRPGGGTTTLGADLLDPVGRKRLKSGGLEPPLALQASGTSGIAATVVGEGTGSMQPETAAGAGVEAISVLTTTLGPEVSAIKSSALYVEQALAGHASATGSAQATSTSTTLNSINAQLQAKVNNPLWSPLLGLVHLPQFPTKYAAQVESELERWIGLSGHMDGAAFADRLTGLIKAVYPSDQKFLLDQILIDFLCWDSNSSQEQDVEETATAAMQCLKELLPPTNTAGSRRSLADIRPGEIVMETILEALVGLVIKPEESSGFLEAGSKKWIESLEMPRSEEVKEQGDVAQATSGSANDISSATATSAAALTPVTTLATSSIRPSAAMGGAKKRRVRNLYNRRVSPFYAVLAMFQPKRVAGRITGMLYLAPEDLVANTQEEGEQQLLKQAIEMPSIINPPVVKEMEEPEQAVVRSQARRLRKQKKEKKRNMKRHGGKVDLDAEEVIDPRGRSMTVSTKMDIDGQAMNADAMLAVWEADREGETTANEGEGEGDGEADSGGKNDGEEAAVIKDDDEKAMDIRDDGEPMDGIQMSQEQGQQAATEDTSTSVISTLPPSDSWMKETQDTDALALAKQVETSRMACQAPFRVLLFVLQYLTKANQGGALDAWITDALSATLQKLQVQYFMWMLAPLALPASRRSRAAQAITITNEQGETVAFEEELLRLLVVLMLAQGIGYEPVKTAAQELEQALHADGSTTGDYWQRVRALIEGH